MSNKSARNDHVSASLRRQRQALKMGGRKKNVTLDLQHSTYLCHLPWLPNSQHVGTTASLPTSNIWKIGRRYRCLLGFSPRPSDSPAWQAAKNCLSNEFFWSRDSIGAEIMVQAEETSPDVALDHSQPPETRGKESLFVGKMKICWSPKNDRLRFPTPPLPSSQ